jgi:hypothetical protein
MVKIARTLLDARLGLAVSRSSYCILLAQQAAETKGHAPLTDQEQAANLIPNPPNR